MFPDAFLPNLIVFLLGQVAAWGYLRTGLVQRGTWLLIATWVAADVALVARFAYDDTGPIYVVALVVMQVLSLVAFALFVFGRIRRRMPSVVARREELFRSAFVHYLRDELDAARKLYERLRRVDPWDLPTRVGLATVLSRIGEHRRARRLWRSVKGLDPERKFSDVVAVELRG